MHKQQASHGPSNCDFSEKEPTDSPEGCKRRGSPATDYTPRAVICEPPFPGSFEVAPALAREGRRFENPPALDWRYDLVVLSRWAHIAFPAPSPFTASKDFVTWSAGEILSSADEKTATILESGAMTNVVRSVNA
jgi:hypothetical protein